MTTKKFSLAAVLAAISCMSWAPQSSASIIETDNSGNSEAFFDGNILSTDLINQGQSTLGSFTPTATSYAFPASGSHDGTATNTSGLTYLGAPAGVDFLYTLAGSATGYDITSINSIYGWGDTRYWYTDQQWVVSVSTVANPTLTPLKTVAYTPFPFNDGQAGSSQVTLTDSTGVLASGVTAINFHLSPNSWSNGQDQIGVLRELDVQGSATVPEPASGLVLVGAMLPFALRRSRRGRVA